MVDLNDKQEKREFLNDAFLTLLLKVIQKYKNVVNLQSTIDTVYLNFLGLSDFKAGALYLLLSDLNFDEDQAVAMMEAEGMTDEDIDISLAIIMQESIYFSELFQAEN